MRFLFGGPRLFGLRTGVILSPRELGFGRAAAPATKGGATGGFVYVVKGDHGFVKIGVSADPIRRLAELQTGSPYPLKLDYVGALTDFGYGLEADAHAALGRYRMAGEWFSCSTEIAVATVNGLAHRRGENIASVAPERVPEIVALANAASVPQPKKSLPRRVMRYALIAFGLLVLWDTILFLIDPKLLDR